jgi:hypothetical protein
MDDYVSLVPRGLQDVVQDLLRKQLQQAAPESSLIFLESLGEDPIHYDAVHLRELQDALSQAFLKKKAKRQKTSTSQEPLLTRHITGTVLDSRTNRHVSLGYDDSTTTMTTPCWSTDGANTGLVWTRFQTDAPATVVASCRCLGSLLAFVHAYPQENLSPASSMEEVLQKLKDEMGPLSSSISSATWSRPLDLWRRHLKQPDLPVSLVVKYRCSSLRDENKKYPYARQDLLQDAAASLRPADCTWKVDLAAFDLEVVWLWRPQGAVVALSLRDYKAVGAHSYAKGILPPDVTPPHLTGHVLSRIVRLRPPTAQLLLHMANLKEGETLVDPCVGIGTTVLECLHLREPRGLMALGGDLELVDTLRPIAVEYTKQTHVWLAAQRQKEGRASVTATMASLCVWDATQMPLATASVDVIVSDLPFGRSCLSTSRLQELIPLLLDECARILRPNEGRMVLLCGNFQALLDGLQQTNFRRRMRDGLSPAEAMTTTATTPLLWDLPVPACRPVNVGGHCVWIVKVRRGGALVATQKDPRRAAVLQGYLRRRDQRARRPHR